MRAIIDSDTPDIREAFIQTQMEPNCGWPWLDQHMRKTHPDQRITILRDGKVILEVAADNKEASKTIKKVIRSQVIK
jgi:hypothetical protein